MTNPYHHHRFHCGLWVEDKGSRGGGHFYHVQFHGPRPSNRPDYPDGWAYDSSMMRDRPANWRQSGNLIGRILLGKLAAGVTAAHVHQACQGVPLPLPRDGREENCWDWTRRAVEEIQRRRWLPAFAWGGRQGFGAQAQRQAVTWYEGDTKMKRNHEWDIFGTDSRHCNVM